MMQFMQLIYFFVLLISFAWGDISDNEVHACNLPAKLKDEIAGYKPVAERIIQSILSGQHRHTTYDRLAEFIDIFGNRIAGSENLENAIDYMLEKSKKYGLENVHGENVSVPRWIRGKEQAFLIKPRIQNLSILGLGSSVGTPSSGITAPVLVVNSFEDLKANCEKATGRIVVFNEKWVSYGVTVKYRDYSAREAAKCGGIAALVASITPFSLNTPHTGWQDYDENVPKIPVACMTVEDAHMLKRMQDRGYNLVINLYMEAKTLPNTISRNTITEIVGKSNPEKIVVVSGHLDSWDVGQGAMDDGAGAFMSWNSLIILKELGLRPRRTLRAVLWTAEEEGLVGAFNYFESHKNELQNHDFIMESDEGTFNPLGIEYAGPEYGACILREVVQLLSPINANQLKWSTNVGSDIVIGIGKGLPGASLLNENEKYFWFHHTQADTMDIEDPDILDKCTAVWATTAYIMADLSVSIPKNLTYEKTN